MFVVTADQVDSRLRADDPVDRTLARMTRLAEGRLVLPPDRTAGDEVQAATEHPDTALDLLLDLARDGQWSIGLGVGEVRRPLPDATRAMSGSAFVLARDAVTAAKKRPTRVAVAVDSGRRIDTETLEPMLDLFLLLRQRRSPEGWEMHDLLRDGLSQADAAARLGITPQAASRRAIAAGLRTDAEARDALVRLLALADERITP